MLLCGTAGLFGSHLPALSGFAGQLLLQFRGVALGLFALRLFGAGGFLLHATALVFGQLSRLGGQFLFLSGRFHGHPSLLLGGRPIGILAMLAVLPGSFHRGLALLILDGGPLCGLKPGGFVPEPALLNVRRCILLQRHFALPLLRFGSLRGRRLADGGLFMPGWQCFAVAADFRQPLRFRAAR